MLESKTALNMSDRELCIAMNDAFSDYAVPLKLSEAGFGQMMCQRGLDRSVSRVAVEGDQIAATWFVSLRNDKAYLISSGTRPQFRSRGIARKLAHDCMADLRSAKIQSLQTEVMDGNDVAASLYFSLGMTVSRQLDCYDIPVIDAPDLWWCDVAAVGWQDVSKLASALRSWEPSWQNSDLSLDAISDRLICARILDDKGLAAYAAVIPDTVTLAQLAVRPDRRRERLGSGLIAYLQKNFPNRNLRVINAQADNVEFASFMSSLSAVRTTSQRELFMLL